VDLEIAGRTALVTGAGRGLGASIVRTLAAEGVCILATSRGSASLEALMRSLPRPETNASCSVDLEHPGGVNELLSWLESTGRSVDIVVNNVGGTLGLDKPLANYQDFLRVMDLNLGVAVEINQRLIPSMVSRGWGRICHVSSISSLENQGPPAYCAAKAALNA